MSIRLSHLQHTNELYRVIIPRVIIMMIYDTSI